ncbi:hypothetical protein GFY24_37575 [Nocardia sp. SYP-A9097]|uniref:hypothetical protein n=1 Tax=Nocardia sp. SYP-A9097 TaxID=2663237 RepID=UPI00129AE845|nr:hypothetical protein [Nocardia sp. SYP-A9097]MRH93068.1 hypothetical protein [Nocardia sp. SYP-A9097]
MSNEMEDAWQLLAEGDVPGTVRALRFIAETTPVRELAEITNSLARAVEFEDLATAAAAVGADPSDSKALTALGYECIERGISFLAIPVLREALRLEPESSMARAELVTAFEDEHRHGEAVEVLLAHESMLRAWPERYLLVYNSILSGQLERAETEFAKLPPPEDERWLFARDRVAGMLTRGAAAGAVAPLDWNDLRGWHFTLTGGYLGTLSPYGFTAGMTGRWAYLGDNPELCRYSLDRLASILNAAGRQPHSVSLLPGRSDRILGLAAAQLLGLPTRPYAPESTDTLVVAYDLAELDQDLVRTLNQRADGQILFEHATCWTRPPAVSADISGLLVQRITAPWEPGLRVDEQAPQADSRAEAEIAEEIVRADGTPDTGDGETPPDTDDSFTAFVAATRDTWLRGPRTPLNSPGPVGSSRFF